MNDLIHRIVEIIIEAGQSDTKKFGLGETIRYSPSEILEILKQHESEIFGEESSAQTNTSNTLNALDCISRQAAKDRLTILVNEIEGIFADIRERNVDDSVCGLCEYDCDHGIDGSAFECPGFERDDCFKLKDEYKEEWTDVKALPSAQPERDIPMKPNETIDSSWGIRKKQAVCPKCDYYLGRVEFIGNPNGKKVTYCETCGQAIDWKGWEWEE